LLFKPPQKRWHLDLLCLLGLRIGASAHAAQTTQIVQAALWATERPAWLFQVFCRLRWQLSYWFRH
jgi:hypothetical protein